MGISTGSSKNIYRYSDSCHRHLFFNKLGNLC
jgi:hypothetical protein